MRYVIELHAVLSVNELLVVRGVNGLLVVQGVNELLAVRDVNELLVGQDELGSSVEANLFASDVKMFDAQWELLVLGALLPLHLGLQLEVRNEDGELADGQTKLVREPPGELLVQVELDNYMHIGDKWRKMKFELNYQVEGCMGFENTRGQQLVLVEAVLEQLVALV